MRAVFRHEMQSYFHTPVGYVFLIMYTLLAGIVYVFVNIGQAMSASMNMTLSAMQLPLLLITPLLTMRLFAEERRMRTDQLLFTMPVRMGSIVTGKLLAAALMLLLAMALITLYPLLISLWAQVSAAQVAAVCLGYYLLGLAMISVGVLISALCVNQVTAAIVTLGVNVFLYLGEHYAVPQLAASPMPWLAEMLNWLPSAARLGDFAQGVISLADVTYFLAFTLLMAFLTCRVIERRRHAKG